MWGVSIKNGIGHGRTKRVHANDKTNQRRTEKESTYVYQVPTTRHDKLHSIRTEVDLAWFGEFRSTRYSLDDDVVAARNMVGPFRHLGRNVLGVFLVGGGIQETDSNEVEGRLVGAHLHVAFLGVVFLDVRLDEDDVTLFDVVEFQVGHLSLVEAFGRVIKAVESLEPFVS